MAFKITRNTKAKGAFLPLQDGAYTVTIKSFHLYDTEADAHDIDAIEDINAQHEGTIILDTSKEGTPYMVVDIDGRQEFVWINNEKTLDFLTQDISTQLKVDSSLDFFEWCGVVVGSQVEMYVLTVEGTDKNTGNTVPYTNKTFRKPAMFDAIINGLT